MSTRTWTIGRSVLFTGVALAAALLVDQLVGCMSAAAQAVRGWDAGIVAADPLPLTTDDLIVQMSRSAAVIFVGHVVEIRRPHTGLSGSPEAAAEGAVEVDFFVDQAVRGPARGSCYSLREWGGLWAGATARYRPGQPLLVLLRAPETAGLSSPVHGAEGLIPLRGGGPPPGPDDSSSTAAEWMVDERWLQAQTLRSPSAFAVPGRGAIPIRGGRGPLSEVPGELESPVPEKEHPLLVRAIPGPWVEQPNVAISTATLSHVLALCMNSSGAQDAAH